MTNGSTSSEKNSGRQDASAVASDEIASQSDGNPFITTNTAPTSVRRQKRDGSTGRREKEADDPSTKVLPGSDSSKEWYVTCTCKLCGREIQTIRKDLLLRHARTHVERKRYGCPKPTCVYEKTQVRDVRRHLKNAHQDITSQPVDRLSPEMEREWENRRNECFPPHTLPDQWTVECRLCGNDIEKRNYLEHARSHESAKRFKCPRCEYASDDSSRVRVHIQGVHQENTKPTNCRTSEMEKQFPKLLSDCFPDCPWQNGGVKRGKREARGMKSREDENDEEEDEESINEREDPKEKSGDNDEVNEMGDGVGEMMIPSGDVSQAGNDMGVSRLACLIVEVVKIGFSSARSNADENKAKLDIFISSMASLCGDAIPFGRGGRKKKDDLIVPSNFSKYYNSLHPHEQDHFWSGSPILDPAEVCVDLRQRYGYRGAIFILGQRAVFYLESLFYLSMVKLIICMCECIEEDWKDVEEVRRSLEEKQTMKLDEEAVKEVANVLKKTGVFPVLKGVMMEKENLD